MANDVSRRHSGERIYNAAAVARPVWKGILVVKTV